MVDEDALATAVYVDVVGVVPAGAGTATAVLGGGAAGAAAGATGGGGVTELMALMSDMMRSLRPKIPCAAFKI